MELFVCELLVVVLLFSSSKENSFERKDFKMLRKLISAKILVNPIQQESRKLWWWTVVMFNRMDVQRTKALGHDR